MIITPLRDWLKDPDTHASEKALYAAVALTFFCLPLGTAPSTIAGGLSIAIWLFSGLAIENRRIYMSPYWWPVYALILLPWLGMTYTQDETGIGLDYAEKTYYWLFGISVAALSFQRFSATRLIQAFMLGLGVNVIAAVAQIVFHLQDKNNQHRGLGPDYSTLSVYLIVGIMMSIYFLNRERRTAIQIALVGIIGLYFFHFVILQSRASYVAFVLLVPFMGYSFFKTKKFLKTIILCILTPALMMLSPIVRERIDLSVKQLRFHLTGDDEAAWGNTYSAQQDRFYMWRGALKIIGDHPLIGVGTGGYQTVLQENDSDPHAPSIAHPHNNFLYMAVSFGAVGLAVFFWFLVVTIRNGWQQRHTVRGYMLLSVILVMVASGFFNTQILDVGTALLISLTVGFQSSFQNKEARVAAPNT